jgi:alpha-tubulin suppressor-like RCC1 family protein
LTGIRSVVSDVDGSCALLTTGQVDCWGDGEYGELGNGTLYTTSPYGSAVPVAVKNVDGTAGTLGDVASLTSDGYGYCARLTSGKVDCWGYAEYGELGHGTFYTTSPYGSAVPLSVKGVGGTGTLSGVANLTNDSYGGYCALLTSGQVDCWGEGDYGQLGNGTFYTASPYGSAVPVAVKNVDGTAGTLGDVASLTSDGYTDGDGYGYCARLTSGKVDCWGYGFYGELGHGTFDTTSPYGSAVPLAVKGVGGTGTLSGVANLTSDGSGSGYCALLTSGQVDCWGDGEYGQLGNGTFDMTSPYGSAVPVAVKNVDGTTGTLGDVASLTGDFDGYCSLLTSGKVDCWGYGYYGELGNGRFYTTSPYGSAVPLAVKNVDGTTGTLGDVASLTSDGYGSCVLLTSGKVDCWGLGEYGELGNGTFYTTSPYGSAVPLAVKGVGGTGTLGAVASLTSDDYGSCVLLTSGQVDCWGLGEYGELGNGTLYTTSPYGSALPVAVGT